MWIAISVELGPGIKFVGPSKSRNSWSLSHLRRCKISSCIMLMCAAGPPKPVIPSFRNTAASSPNRSEVGLFTLVDRIILYSPPQAG
jgi:hypothetical protein